MQRKSSLALALAAICSVTAASAQVPPAGSATPGGWDVSAGGEFDNEAAKKSLGTIEYKSCGRGGTAKVVVTFAPDGTADGVAIIEGTYEAETAVCIARRFMLARVPAFTGPARTVKWGIRLEPVEGAPTATLPQPAPNYAPTYAPRPFDGPRVIDAGTQPLPPGYREEEHHRGGLLISGSIIGGTGLLMGAVALAAAGSGSRSSSTSSLGTTYGVLSVIHLAIGIPLFIAGMGTKRVFVRNDVSVHLAPIVTASTGGAALTLLF